MSLRERLSDFASKKKQELLADLKKKKEENEEIKQIRMKEEEKQRLQYRKDRAISKVKEKYDRKRAEL